MSPSLRDILRIGLCPDRVLFARYGRGLRPKLLKKGVCPTSSTTEQEPWRSALAVLPNVLRDEAPRSTDATIVLSSHFVRYLVLGASENLSTRDEWREYASHRFESVHGTRAATWDIRVADAPAAQPRLASAVDKALIDAALAAFEGSRVRLESIQPYLAVAFNQALSAAPADSFWFALQEPGRLLLAFIGDGVWRGARSRRVDGRWHEELPNTVERESALLSAGAGCRDVLLSALGAEEPASSSGLKLTSPAGVAADDRAYAMVRG